MEPEKLARSLNRYRLDVYNKKTAASSDYIFLKHDLQMNTIKRLFIIGIFLLPAFRALTLFAQDRQFSALQIKEDIVFLRNNLERWHPGLYQYSTRDEVNACFDRLILTVPDSLTEWGAYSFITAIGAVIRDGHTLFYPSETVIDNHNLNSGFFPFKTWWNGKSLFVEMNYADEPEIPDGAEIISINGQSAGDIFQFCLNHMMRDGYNQSYPTWVLNNWFREYYSYFFGHPGSFNLVIRDKAGNLLSKTVEAIPKSKIAANRKQKYPWFNADIKEKDGIVLTLDEVQKTAVLTIRDFHADILKKEYKQPFKKTINDCFERIRTSDTKHLILDIRDNQGGETRYAKLLLSHLFDTSFQLLEAYYKVDKSFKGDSARRLKKCHGPTDGTYKPRPNSFKGKLYILVNGGSFSNSGILSAALRRYKRGVFIGEETGGNKHSICGSVKYCILPHTNIRVEIPTLQYVISDKQPNSGHGTIPDYIVLPGLDNLLGQNDVVKQFALELIRSDNSR